MFKAARSFPIAVGIVFLAACGDDGITDTSGDVLDADEAVAVLSAISDIFGGVLLGSASPPPSAVVPVSETFNFSEACPRGGSVSLAGKISGDVDVDGTNGSFRVDFTESISGCRVMHDATEFIVNGAPSLDYGGNLSIAITGSTTFVWNGSIDLAGGFSFSGSDGRQGRCGVGVKYSYAGTGVSWNGTVCGQPVSGSISLRF